MFLYQGKIETDRLAGKKYSCKERYHGFSVSIEKLRSRYCAEEKPYVIREDKEFESILSGFFQKNMAHPELAKAKLRHGLPSKNFPLFGILIVVIAG